MIEGAAAGTSGVVLAGKNPQFADAANGNLNLKDDSPCIDAGSGSFYAIGEMPDISAVTTDKTGNLRVQGEAIDLGAYETEGCPCD
jgi:hypothetical protein